VHIDSRQDDCLRRIEAWEGLAFCHQSTGMKRPRPEAAAEP
jgi:hypothetical protein